MVYALWLDELEMPRHQARARLDELLERPFDPVAAEQFDRDRWGFSPEQIQAQLATERLAEGATF